MTIIERWKALSRTTDWPRSIVDERSRRQDILYIAEASERVAQLCEMFHGNVERMTKESGVGAREARTGVEKESQQGVAWPGEQMLRLARELAERVDNAGRLEETEERDSEGIDRSELSSTSKEEDV